MKCRVTKVAAFLLGVVSSVADQVSPVQKVIQLLDGMKDKGEQEMQADQTQHNEQTKFCEETLRDKSRAMEEAGDKIEQLNADIAKFESSIKTYSTQLAGYNHEINTDTKDIEDANALRAQEKK